MATYSKTTICNIALANLRQGERLSNFDSDTSGFGIDCRLFYPLMLQELLEEFEWPLQERYIDLQLIILNPNIQWKHEYLFPVDCAAAIEIVNKTRVLYPHNKPPYLVAHNDTGQKVIWTDKVDAVLKYTAIYENENQYSAVFIDALAWKIAWRLVPTLTKSQITVRDAKSKYEEAFNLAKAQALNKESQEQDPENELAASRH